MAYSIFKEYNKKMIVKLLYFHCSLLGANTGYLSAKSTFDNLELNKTKRNSNLHDSQFKKRNTWKIK